MRALSNHYMVAIASSGELEDVRESGTYDLSRVVEYSCCIRRKCVKYSEAVLSFVSNPLLNVCIDYLLT